MKYQVKQTKEEQRIKTSWHNHSDDPRNSFMKHTENSTRILSENDAPTHFPNITTLKLPIYDTTSRSQHQEGG